MRLAMLGLALNILAVGAVLGFAAPAGATNYLCNQAFALCTSAPCIPQPGNPDVSICVCEMQEGPNLATVPCDTVRPSTDANGVRTVYSQFALTQFQQGKKGLRCPSGTPWSQCLNKICTVDPANPDKAICACDVVRSGEWQTAGGDCQAATCGTAYWSGALLADSRNNADFMMQQLKIATSPAEACPVPTP
ncbi:hypothetical protein [Ancylobacter polymorphus]|uniref:Uncharacterized protein n=1 Tax=Ancylobacter polymorphus TaxID=223390 RepID=A0ABU0B9U1_9HYPH|nr:hypothetical protein [Ancylobacter polymorphus]MDQ0302596.1 hypothetical protein [Ancylobacter polymorphus]